MGNTTTLVLPTVKRLSDDEDDNEREIDDFDGEADDGDGDGNSGTAHSKALAAPCNRPTHEIDGRHTQSVNVRVCALPEARRVRPPTLRLVRPVRQDARAWSCQQHRGTDDIGDNTPWTHMQGEEEVHGYARLDE